LAYELEQKSSCICPKAENKENIAENRDDLIAKVKDLET
jgi:chromatin segregation and condensation protein Rec8/ScpA/Scc1 (kleisin family)